MSLPTQYQQYIHLSRYARFNDELGRRETWEETVKRYFDFLEEHVTENHEQGLERFLQDRPRLEKAVLNLDVMPSMRLLMTAGKAVKRDNVAAFNCSYLPVDDVRAFDECMYILMCGTGVGFSVERQFINKLPEVAEEFHETDTCISVRDSKIGWASAFRELISLLYNGRIPQWDVSKIRPKGSRLKTFGGRASGAEPLEDLFNFTVERFRAAAGRKLSSIECHDLMCKIGEIVVVGGVRRSALISLSNLTDDRMRRAKTGQWWETEPQRALANNSVAYTETPDMESFMKEWLSLYESKSGERGIFNREAAKNVVKRNGRRDPEWEFGTNPCSEIILRPNQFCNLTEVVVRPEDTYESLAEKVDIASYLGTLQSTLTNFRYLRKCWKNNTDEERLLGVSLTGIEDNKLTTDIRGNYQAPEVLKHEMSELRQRSIEANKLYSTSLDIPQSTAITCVKPSGTVSQLVDSASGIHPRYAPYYIRRVRGDAKDPVTQLMIDQGVPHEMCHLNPSSVVVFDFPMKSPEGSTMRDDRSALEQLELWKLYQDAWCEHKPSITVYVKEHEWMEVGAWVWKNINYMSGVSFLPHSNHSYRQAPYEEITQDHYDEMLKSMPSIDWSRLSEYEKEDHTTSSQELACTGGACELI